MQDYAPGAQCTWTPQDAQYYTLVVEAEIAGATDGYFVTTYITFNITPVNLTGVTLTTSLQSPQSVATQIMLTAAAQGGIAPANVEYQFLAQYSLPNGTYSPLILLRDYATNPLYAWTPTSPQGYYLLIVDARVVGSTVPYNVYAYTPYVIK